MKYYIRALFLLSFLLIFSLPVQSQDWRDKMENIIYSPRYFGPNGFPIPEIRENVSMHYEIEVRGEYHSYTGDKTKDRS